MIRLRAAFALAATCLLISAATAQSLPSARIPDETAGIDAIARTLLTVFDHADIIELGDWHGRISVDSDLRLAMVRLPDFAKKVHAIVIECAAATEQATLDRYTRGENVPKAQLERVWKATNESTNGFCDAPAYPGFLKAVRDVNAKLPAGARIRVFGGHPGPGANRGIEATVVSILKDQVIATNGKALVIFGAAHFYRTMPPEYLSSMGNDIGLARKLDAEFPGRSFVVIPIGPLELPHGAAAGKDPDFREVDRVLKTSTRPVLVSLQRLPFRDFSAEEFLGRTVMSCRGAGNCASAFKGSAIVLGKIADAAMFVR